MKNTDNLNAFRSDAVKNHMPPGMVLAIPRTNIITTASSMRFPRQQMKTDIQPRRIDVSLLTSPGHLRILANRT